jgi:teichuronic acid exporter
MSGGRPAPDTPVAARAVSTAPTAQRRLREGLVWQGGMRWAAQVVSWLVTLVVARRLTPDEYGVASLAAAFAVSSAYITEFGIGRAVVMQRITDRRTLTRLHGVSIVLGIALAALLCLLAPHIAVWWREPRVTAPLLVWSITFVFGGFLAVPLGRVQRALRYRVIGIVELTRGLVQGLAVLVLALAGAGLWALVLGYVIATAVSLVAYLRLAWLRPTIPHPREWRALLAYPKHIIAGNISWYGYANADYLVSGRMLGVDALGHYQFAWNIAQLPSDKLTSVLQSVTGPLFGSVGGDTDRLRALVLDVLELTSLLVFPVTVGLALVAADAIPLIFGAQWVSSIGPMQLLLVNGALLSLSVMLNQALTAAGQASVTGRLGLALLVMMPLGYIVGARVAGNPGIAAVWLLAQPLILGVPLRLSRKVMGLRTRQIWDALRPAAVAVLLMIAGLLLLRPVLSAGHPVVSLVVQVLTGAVIYAGVLSTVFRERSKAMLRKWGRS